jgi:phosphatidylglycerophosphate synthase
MGIAGTVLPAMSEADTGRAAADRPLTEGERWAREQLAALLAARFSPTGVGRFLIASQRRANHVRRARPELGRQAWGWMAAGGAVWAALAAGGAQPFRRRWRSGLAWWAGCSVMLDWHLGMVETVDGRPRPLGAADAVTLARAWLVPVALDSPSALVCGLAGATDVVDGWLARAAEPTRIGRDLEGLVDTCFAAAALRAGVREERIGRGVVAGELARLAAGFGYALYVYFGRADAPDPRVTRAARATTPVRVAGLIAAALGRRRLAGALLGGGALWSVAALASSLRSSG